eukprot:2364323-Pleurochrysis_carterae.AAC.1
MCARQAPPPGTIPSAMPPRKAFTASSYLRGEASTVKTGGGARRACVRAGEARGGENWAAAPGASHERVHVPSCVVEA